MLASQPSKTIPAQEKFVTLLRELFQIGDIDLDFGIYRVLQQERKLIGEFLDDRLGPIVRDALGAADATQRAALEAELEAIGQSARAAGFEPENAPNWKNKKAEIDALGDSDALETEVYNGLTDFFGRY